MWSFRSEGRTAFSIGAGEYFVARGGELADKPAYLARVTPKQVIPVQGQTTSRFHAKLIVEASTTRGQPGRLFLYFAHENAGSINDVRTTFKRDKAAEAKLDDAALEVLHRDQEARERVELHAGDRIIFGHKTGTKLGANAAVTSHCEYTVEAVPLVWALSNVKEEKPEVTRVGTTIGALVQGAASPSTTHLIAGMMCTTSPATPALIECLLRNVPVVTTSWVHAIRRRPQPWSPLPDAADYIPATGRGSGSTGSSGGTTGSLDGSSSMPSSAADSVRQMWEAADIRVQAPLGGAGASAAVAGGAGTGGGAAAGGGAVVSIGNVRRRALGNLWFAFMKPTLGADGKPRRGMSALHRPFVLPRADGERFALIPAAGTHSDCVSFLLLLQLCDTLESIGVPVIRLYDADAYEKALAANAAAWAEAKRAKQLVGEPAEARGGRCPTACRCSGTTSCCASAALLLLLLLHTSFRRRCHRRRLHRCRRHRPDAAPDR